MNVILEGPDGGGKSTLAAYLGGALDLRVQQGSGPPKNHQEIEDRLASYLAMDNLIFDRHPAVSQCIYGTLRGETMTASFDRMVEQLYGQKPLFVYCRATDASRHVVKAGEDPAHIDVINRRYTTLVELYDRWALQHAQLIYRIGDDRSELTDIIRVLAC